ncbi:MAG: glycosyltransferase [Planctomycetes bacterium]|jgi:cellulose synthase/poly-beta-1,6-N-acetylglucosamine synthase-like glycosyltransferase|nr:glycosyltransferase [Planctomycetota bacterium]
MQDWAWYLLVPLWIAWGTQGVLAPILVGRFYSRLRHPRRAGFDAYRPRAAVIVPFKGAEPALADNVRALLTQDYPDYRVLLVVESADDPAYGVLRDAAAAHPGRAEVLCVGQAGPHEGQKVHNLVAAIDHLERRAGDEAVWVFADSDAVPGPSWLGDLVGPLVQEQTGVSTGYRWLIPEPLPGEKRPRFWAHAASILNASATSFAGKEKFNHAWGGSMALRTQTARELGLRGWLEGSLSDDYQVTRMIRGAGLRVYFVVRCLVASPVAFDARGFAEFVRRQYLITRIHAPAMFRGGLLLLLHYQLGLWSALGVMLYTAWTHPAWWAAPGFLLPLLALLVVAGSDQVRATIRWMLVRRAFGAQIAQEMRSTHLIDRFLSPFWMTLNFVLLLSAAVGRTITWRGITYRMHAPQKIERFATSPNTAR